MGERIKELRKALGMTLSDFGKKIGISNQAVSSMENGKSNPSEQTIRAIIREFDVNDVWLRTGVGEMKRPMTWQQEVTSYVNDLVKGNRTEFEETLIRFMAATTPEDWERLSVIFRKIQNEKKTEAE